MTTYLDGLSMALTILAYGLGLATPVLCVAALATGLRTALRGPLLNTTRRLYARYTAHRMRGHAAHDTSGW